MENTELINLWKTYDKKLEENIIVNQKNVEEITKLKVNSLLTSMKPTKLFAIVFGILWVLLLDSLVFTIYPFASIYFLVSALIHIVLSKLAIGIYIYHLILLDKADISKTVIETQENLAKLKSSTLLITRLLFLQLPVWTTFYWNKTMLENGNILAWSVQLLVTIAFTIIALWLFFNIKDENKDKKWFKLIFSGKEWVPMFKSMELLNDIKVFKSEVK
jgi:glucan phosphoethanolaminetransferase (alkaline phosphatase superfamily)